MKTYEQAVAEFNAAEDAKEKMLLDEHSGAHCPAGQHVWQPSIVAGIENCMVCKVGRDIGPRWTCQHCGPISWNPKERRANELRKMLYDGQKAGTIAPPVDKGSMMGFLWNRK